jgi:hypothetical protein
MEVPMRSFVTPMFAFALALAPAAARAQATTTTAQPPAGQQLPAPPKAAPAPPKLNFSSPAGLLLVQVKSDQTAVFEEMMSKIKSGLSASDISELKQESAGLKLYRAAEGMGGNALYVIVADPAMPGGEYSFLDALAKGLTPEQLRDPATSEMYKKYLAAYAPDGKPLGLNKLNLTPVGGGQ